MFKIIFSRLNVVLVLVFTALTLDASLNRPTGADSQSPVERIVPGVNDLITVRNMSVYLPPGAGWEKQETPMPQGGRLLEFERQLPNGNRVQIHIADYFGATDADVPEFAFPLPWANDEQRLAALIAVMESVSGPDVRNTEWLSIPRAPQTTYGAVCRERHDVREEKLRKKLFLWQDWMLFCVDPISHIPIEIDYAERYPAARGAPSPTFESDAGRFFDSIQFPLGTSLEVTAALVQANTRLFSDGGDPNDYPAEVVFTLDPGVTKKSLSKLGGDLFTLKNTFPMDTDRRAVAQRVSDETYRPYDFLAVPRSLSGSDRVFMSGVMIHRRLLPKGHLGKGSGYGDFLLKCRVHLFNALPYRVEHTGIEWQK